MDNVSLANQREKEEMYLYKESLEVWRQILVFRFCLFIYHDVWRCLGT